MILGWRARTQAGEEAADRAVDARPQGELPTPSLADFRRQQLDLYIPAGETGYWQGGLYDPEEPGYRDVMEALRSDGGVIYVDLLYGDHEGGQLMIVRFGMSEWPSDGDEEIGERAYVLRYWEPATSRGRPTLRGRRRSRRRARSGAPRRPTRASRPSCCAHRSPPARTPRSPSPSAPPERQ